MSEANFTLKINLNTEDLEFFKALLEDNNLYENDQLDVDIDIVMNEFKSLFAQYNPELHKLFGKNYNGVPCIETKKIHENDAFINVNNIKYYILFDLDYKTNSECSESSKDFKIIDYTITDIYKHEEAQNAR